MLTGPFKCFLATLSSKQNLLNFKWIKYLGKGLSYLKNGGIGVNYCWNYMPLKLLLHVIEYNQKQQ